VRKVWRYFNTGKHYGISYTTSTKYWVGMLEHKAMVCVLTSVALIFMVTRLRELESQKVSWETERGSLNESLVKKEEQAAETLSTLVMTI